MRSGRSKRSAKQRRPRFDKGPFQTRLTMALLGGEREVKVLLTPKLEEMVRDKVASGLYSDPSEVIREALRLMHEQGDLRRLKLDRLREEIAKGEADIAAGRFTALNSDEEIQAFFADL